MKVILLIDDIAGRFKKGEVGELLENDFKEKYDFKVLLNGATDIYLAGKHVEMSREFYFYKDEVRRITTTEVLNPNISDNDFLKAQGRVRKIIAREYVEVKDQEPVVKSHHKKTGPKPIKFTIG